MYECNVIQVVDEDDVQPLGLPIERKEASEEVERGRVGVSSKVH